jgi:site-specific DNA recombinase
MPDLCRATAIYARISSDPAGTGLGVQRQLEDCRALAERLGWPVADEYVDPDVSASSRKRRPEYERMLADLQEGRRDALIAYHVDRLYRKPIELERLLEVATPTRVRIRFVTGQELDLSNGDGLMVIRMLVAVAANESATKSRRVLRKMEQNAVAGLPHGGGGYHRPYGCEGDKITIRDEEAQVVRSMAERFLAGESTRSLARWAQAQGIRTTAGGSWRTDNVRMILASGRIAGLREHRGSVVGPAAWPAIISVEQRDRILARFAANARSGRRGPRRYLLSGLLRCGRCDNRLFSSARRTERRYVCLSGPDHGGCGHLTVVAEPLERLVTDAVLYRLDTPALADALDGRAAKDAEAARASDLLATARFRRDEASHEYAAGHISMSALRIVHDDIDEQTRKLDAAIARLTHTDAIAGYVGDGARLRDAWAGITVSRQHAVIKAVLDRVVVMPGKPGSRSVDPGRVSPVWRL